MKHGFLYSCDASGLVVVWRLDTWECVTTFEVSFNGILPNIALHGGLVYCENAKQAEGLFQVSKSHFPFKQAVAYHHLSTPMLKIYKIYHFMVLIRTRFTELQPWAVLLN